MKLTIITTPIQDALGITAEVSATIAVKAQRIAAISYDSFIQDSDALTVALYASHSSACAELLKLPSNDPRKLAAETAKDLHFNPSCIPHLAGTGYFNNQLCTLLRIARNDPDHGSKLIQVFLTMLQHQDEHQLDSHLVGDIQRFLAMKDFTEGYLLIEQTDDEYIIMLSCWAR